MHQRTVAQRHLPTSLCVKSAAGSHGLFQIAIQNNSYNYNRSVEIITI